MLTNTSGTDILLSELDAFGDLSITLNNHERRNPLSKDLLTRLRGVIEDASENDAVRVIVIASVGPVFSAGHDLWEMTEARISQDKGRAFFEELLALCSKVMASIVTSPKPVIAEVGGVATAAGCQLVASCDLAIASDTARFATPGVNIGSFCSTPMVALSRNVSNKHAMEMLLTGDMYSAEQAIGMGLINRTCASEDLENEVTERARRIASKSRHANAIGKRAFYAQREMELSKAYEYATGVMVENMLAEDAVEGVGAFFEKRTPVWKDA